MDLTWTGALRETELVCFSIVDDLFKQTVVKPEEVSLLAWHQWNLVFSRSPLSSLSATAKACELPVAQIATAVNSWSFIWQTPTACNDILSMHCATLLRLQPHYSATFLATHPLTCMCAD